MEKPYYDSGEIRDRTEREAAQLASTAGCRRRRLSAPRWPIGDYAAFAAGDRQPALARHAAVDPQILELIELQRQTPPFGGFSPRCRSAASRGFSPRPGRFTRSKRDGGSFAWLSTLCGRDRAGELIHNTFSYHLTPARTWSESAALALGTRSSPPAPGRPSSSSGRSADLRPAICRAPSFSRSSATARRGRHGGISSLDKALVSAEAFPAVLRAEFRAKGIAALQCYGTADLGLIAYETTAPDGAVCDGMVVDEGIILELVEPGTGKPVAPGEVGEIVVTTLTPEYPLIRFATGDLSALLLEPSPCGRTNLHHQGLGSAAPTSRPRCAACSSTRCRSARSCDIQPAVRRRPAGDRARKGADAMTLLVETGAPDEGGGNRRRRRWSGDQAARRSRLRSRRQPAGRRQADRRPPADRLGDFPGFPEFTESPQFVRTSDDAIAGQCRMGKARPYRFVPQTSHPADSIGREPRGSGSPPPEPLFFRGRFR